MMKLLNLQPRFVVTLPDVLDSGVLYISIEYSTVAHMCCCGCGVEVVTPLSPTDWKITFDGESVSLWPSVGNWNEACRSHYVIDRNRVVAAGPWSEGRIEAEWKRNKKAKQDHYLHRAESPEPQLVTPPPAEEKKAGWWSKFRGWMKGS